MPTRPLSEIEEQIVAKWTPETHEIYARASAMFAHQVEAQAALGRQLAELRRGARLTQEELAARADIGQGDISRIERGLGNPTRDTLIRLAAAVGARLALVPDEALQTLDPQAQELAPARA